MAQPDNRTRYRRRQALVEPVFGHLRTGQGLNRFRRKGLKGVRVESPCMPWPTTSAGP